MVAMRIFDTPVKVEETIPVPVVALRGGLTWYGLHRHPKRGWGEGALIGLASVIVLAIVDGGHAVAHIFSARPAGAPMDELHIMLSAGMPRTFSWDNAVSPDAHRIRAPGGPIFNAPGFLLSLAIHRAAARDSLARDLAGRSTLGHGLWVPLGLVPLPTVDGGTPLKWTLVARGRSEAEADATVRRVGRGMGILGAIVGVGVIVGWTASSIVVRTGMTVFDVAIPPGAKARAQLMSLARTLVKRQPG